MKHKIIQSMLLSLSSSSKNVADMKILTDCAFDVLQLTSTGNTSVTLVTKDCDFLPLVYRLTSIGVPVSVPMIGKDKLMTVPRSAVTKALEEKNYNPMSSDTWLLPQLPIVEKLLRNDFNYSTIAHFCNRKRSRFIRAVANNNSLLITNRRLGFTGYSSIDSANGIFFGTCVDENDNVIGHWDTEAGQIVYTDGRVIPIPEAVEVVGDLEAANYAFEMTEVLSA